MMARNDTPTSTSGRGAGGKVQDQDQGQGQGQGQDHLLLQRAALPQLYLVLALTLDLAQIIKLPLLNYLCSLLLLLLLLLLLTVVQRVRDSSSSQSFPPPHFCNRITRDETSKKFTSPGHKFIFI